MIRRMGIGGPLAMALAGSAILAVAATTASNLWLSGRMIDMAAEQELSTLQEFLAGSINSEAERALSLAESLAGNGAVQEAFATGDRDRLARMLVPGFKGLSEHHGLRQLQFHIAPATSFLRVHKPEKFGDDLSSFRATVVEVNRTGKPVHGLENGVEGLGIRGVVPVMQGTRQTGSVEVGLTFGQSFFDRFKQSTGAEVAFYLKADKGFDVFASTFGSAPH